MLSIFIIIYFYYLFNYINRGGSRDKFFGWVRVPHALFPQIRKTNLN